MVLVPVFGQRPSATCILSDTYVRNFVGDAPTCADAHEVNKCEKQQPSLGLVLLSEQLACRSQMDFFLFHLWDPRVVLVRCKV